MATSDGGWPASTNGLVGAIPPHSPGAVINVLNAD